jgi:hypothetical protein
MRSSSDLRTASWCAIFGRAYGLVYLGRRREALSLSGDPMMKTSLGA